jgi:hypothetical protein
MELIEMPRFKCNFCEKTFCTIAIRRRHETSFAHSTGIPCQLCKKSYSRTDDLSKHLQNVHDIGFKKAGRKAGAWRNKAKRRSKLEDAEMAAAINRQLLPQKRRTTPVMSETKKKLHTIESTTRLLSNLNEVSATPTLATIQASGVSQSCLPPSQSPLPGPSDSQITIPYTSDSISSLPTLPSWESWEKLTNNEVMREEEVFPTEMILALNPNFSSDPNTEALRDPLPQNAPSETSYSGNINTNDEVSDDPLQGVIITIPEPLLVHPSIWSKLS